MDINSREDVDQFIRICIEKCNLEYNTYVPVKENLSIIWFNKGTFAGKAKLLSNDKYVIMLNTQLWKYNRVHLLNTITHEVAHLVVFNLKKQKRSVDPGHGKDWRIVHRFLGGNASRTHSLQLDGARKTKFHKYRTTSGYEVLVTATVHNKILKGAVRRCLKTSELFGYTHYIGMINQ